MWEKTGRTRAIRRIRIAPAAKPPPRICRALCGISACAPHREKAFSDPEKAGRTIPEMRRFTMLKGNAKHTKAAAPADEGFSLSRRALCAFRKPCFISHKLAAFNFIAIFPSLNNAAFTKLCKFSNGAPLFRSSAPPASPALLHIRAIQPFLRCAKFNITAAHCAHTAVQLFAHRAYTEPAAVFRFVGSLLLRHSCDHFTNGHKRAVGIIFLKQAFAAKRLAHDRVTLTTEQGGRTTENPPFSMLAAYGSIATFSGISKSFLSVTFPVRISAEADDGKNPLSPHEISASSESEQLASVTVITFSFIEAEQLIIGISAPSPTVSFLICE